MADFIPRETQVASIEGGAKLQVIFREEEGATCEVILLQEQVPGFVAQLVSHIEQGQVVPIRAQSLRIGRDFQFVGWSIQRNAADGRRRLIALIDLPDEGRQVTLPLEFSEADVEELRRQLA